MIQACKFQFQCSVFFLGEVFFFLPLWLSQKFVPIQPKRESQHSKVFLKVEAATDEGKKPLPSFVSKTLEFTAGDGHICDALECALVWRDTFWQEQKRHTFESKVPFFECLQDVLFKLVCTNQ